jgi:hypothetical protein
MAYLDEVGMDGRNPEQKDFTTETQRHREKQALRGTPWNVCPGPLIATIEEMGTRRTRSTGRPQSRITIGFPSLDFH